MLNIGHATAAAVYAIWHVRHNIVGVPGPDGQPVKDFLRPISLSVMELAAKKEIPKQISLQSLDNDPSSDVVDLSALLSPSSSPSSSASSATDDKAGNLFNVIPKVLRFEVHATVEELAERLKPSPLLKVASVLAHSVRITPSEDMRALITYNSDSDQWPGVQRFIYIFKRNSYRMEFHFLIIHVISLFCNAQSNMDAYIFIYNHIFMHVP